jgi:hypothetical protein
MEFKFKFDDNFLNRFKMIIKSFKFSTRFPFLFEQVFFWIFSTNRVWEIDINKQICWNKAIWGTVDSGILEWIFYRKTFRFFGKLF